MIERTEGHGRSGLRLRVYVLVGIGVLVPALVVSTISFLRLRGLDDALLRARVDAAEAVAHHVDEALQQELEVLQRLASSPKVNGPADLESERALLRESYRRLHFVGGVFLLDARGEVLLEEPPRDVSLAPPRDLPELREVLRTGKPRVTSVVGARGERRIYALVSVMDWQGRIAGVVGGLLDASLSRHTDMLRHAARGFGGYADVVDGSGVILASTDRARVATRESCAPYLASLARERRPVAGTCRGCHGSSVVPWVLAFAPLASAPWGVAVLQPEEEVLATSRTIPRDFPLYALGILGVAGIFAWGAARSVIRPVQVLTDAAEGIAAGRIEQPIPELGEDEIGRLGSSLERMRTSLRDLLHYRERYQHELEERVLERTVALARANEQLREREEARARLLRMVITAQEDERKRIARELHDDTSQNLAVLVMGIESASQALRSNGPAPRLDEVKALAVHALDEVHRMIHDLRPSVLDDLGLFSAIRWYAERHVASRGIAVRCEVAEPEPKLPSAWQIALFRICQEAMNNVVRHAQADSLLVQVGVDAGELHLELEDDGRGFDRAAVASGERGHWGLLGIEERAAILGGSVRIESAPGEGTRVVVRVPLPAAEEGA